MSTHDKRDDVPPKPVPVSQTAWCDGIPLLIDSRKLATALAVVVIGLAAGSTAAYALYAVIEPGTYRGIIEIAMRFDLNHEVNVPTWYASSSLLSCAFLLGIIAVAKRRGGGPFVLHWGLLSLVFLYLSMDEASGLHEILIVPLRRRLGTHGLLYEAWVIPAFVLVCLFALSFLRFLWHLDRRTRSLFIYAGVTYVGGALGLEMIDGAIAEVYGPESLRYLVVMTAEEMLEMLGVIIFLCALLDYLQHQFGPLRLQRNVPAAMA